MIRRFALAAIAVAALWPLPAAAIEVKNLDAGKGISVWYVADHSLPMIAMTASLPAGSAYDPQGRAGLANFAADLADEGAGKLDSDAFQSALNSRGIRLNFTVTRDRLTIQLVTLTANAPEAFRLLGTALAEPHFDAAAIARVRAQILANLQSDEEDPATVATRGFYREYFRGAPYAHNSEGDPASINAIDAGDLTRFARSHWTRGRLTAAVSGDTDAARLKALLASAFGGLPLAPPPLPPRPGAVGAPGVHQIPMSVPQASAVFGLPGLERADPDFLAGYVANYILGGGGFSSRLMNEVREKRGLTYGIGTDMAPYEQAGLWLGQVASKAQSMGETIEIVKATLRKFAAEGPSEQELADAKTYLTGSFPLGFDSNTGTANVLGAYQAEGLPIDYVRTRNAKIQAVTLAEVKAVAAKLFSAGRLTVVVAGPQKPH